MKTEHSKILEPATSKTDINTAIEILAKTYAKAPNITWMLSPTERNLKTFFTMVVEEAAAKNGVYLTPNRKGVLIMYDMNSSAFRVSSFLRKIYLSLFVMGIKQSIKVMKQQKLQVSHRPKSGLYALALAVVNDSDRWKTALSLKRGFEELYHSLNKTVYAETTSSRYLQLYESLGFECYHTIKHPYAKLNIWYLKKP